MAQPAQFVTVRFGYEQQCLMTIDCPCAMLLARIVKKCAFKFPDMPADLTRFDLKEADGGAVAGLPELGLNRANEHLKSRGVYDYVGFNDEGEEYALCQEEPVPEPEPSEAEAEEPN
eukprot:TRINITY_DN6378_c0_g1_i3.p1 TRINITY_DN6378_c0_g1~~TRINITY_DN6378_c0_g1_i3.p1  ORF type:complete len:117 (-),score=33.51 TRINITY_DN6378_c0_g1_i3:313-663(-)